VLLIDLGTPVTGRSQARGSLVMGCANLIARFFYIDLNAGTDGVSDGAAATIPHYSVKPGGRNSRVNFQLPFHLNTAVSGPVLAWSCGGFIFTTNPKGPPEKNAYCSRLKSKLGGVPFWVGLPPLRIIAEIPCEEAARRELSTVTGAVAPHHVVFAVPASREGFADPCHWLNSHG